MQKREEGSGKWAHCFMPLYHTGTMKLNTKVNYILGENIRQIIRVMQFGNAYLWVIPVLYIEFFSLEGGM